MKVKVEQYMVLLHIRIWHPERSNQLPRFTQLVGAEPEPPPPTLWLPVSLALLCLQRLLGKSAEDFLPSFIPPPLMQALYWSLQVVG